ncbi:MAG: hypothetical protein MJ062_06225 [Oscillospiraceae bacterium]|nr:hypothetical protein [Oscillospiraceae bacterium]
MLRLNNLPLKLGYSDEDLQKIVANTLKINPSEILSAVLAKRSVDARKGVQFIASVDLNVKNEAQILRKCAKNKNLQKITPFVMPIYPKRKTAHPPVIIGCGPAGLFAADVLAQAGLCPILLERGKPVSERQKSVAAYHSTGVLDPESNVQFGEGGAGTFSDGKLNTGTKSPQIRQVLQTFVDCGAPDEILWQAKPHIGTDKLAECIPTLRRRIEQNGGQVLFGAKCIGFTAQNGQIVSVEYVQGGVEKSIRTDAAIFAVGHSARDVFAMFQNKSMAMEQKAFSLGVRIEHRQRDIDKMCYGTAASHPALGAASYKLAAHLPDGRGVYTFCMCPGGVVQAAASEAETVVTNGMSCFARDAENANSALLVGISPADFGSDDVLAGVALQRKIEHDAFLAGGSTGKAPVTLLEDFLKNQQPRCFGDVQPSYPLGTVLEKPESCLPKFICDALRTALPKLDSSLHGFLRNDAVLTAPETRSSSPVRVLRNAETLESVSVRGLYPCGEGAGYAGGIVSAAVDGIRCAERIIQRISDDL